MKRIRGKMLMGDCDLFCQAQRSVSDCPLKQTELNSRWLRCLTVSFQPLWATSIKEKLSYRRTVDGTLASRDVARTFVVRRCRQSMSDNLLRAKTRYRFKMHNSETHRDFALLCNKHTAGFDRRTWRENYLDKEPCDVSKKRRNKSAAFLLLTEGASLNHL